MINYPLKRPPQVIKPGSTANRGMDLEEAINQTNEYYALNDVAYIYKKPIPIQVVKVDYERRSAARISEAYYKIPSTTDYNGIYKGRYIDFEAKETQASSNMAVSVSSSSLFRNSVLSICWTAPMCHFSMTEPKRDANQSN